MSDSEVEVEFSKYLVHSTIKNSNNEERKQCSAKGMKPSIFLNTNVDKNHLYNLSKELIRIEYPGLVKNASKAIDTLGGMYGIEKVVTQPRSRLELRFHPDNKFNKPCHADRDNDPGLLIRIRKKDGNVDYDIVGYTGLTFKFNKICEFQYLPLMPTSKFSEDEVEYIHDKIIPSKIPDLEYFLSKENVEQPIYSLPASFTRYESQNTLYLKAAEKFNTGSTVRPQLFKMWQTKKPRNRIQTKSITKVVNMQDNNIEIPEEALPITMELINDRMWQAEYEIVKKLFDEKPMWTKIAILHRTGLSMDMTKVILPALAYFFPAGPWRMVWAKFGYNPLQDFNSRIYQTLDFRIRSKEGTKIKVRAKRSYTKKLGTGLGRQLPQPGDDPDESNPCNFIEERSYILSPEFIPPARQMFYQYCDIRIPEIQEMLRRLPKLPSHKKFDPKIGWLPSNFADQCREIANRHIIDRVRQELVKDSIKFQQQQNREKAEEAKQSTSTYCSQMLSNIKKGIYTSDNMLPFGGSGGGETSADSKESPMEMDSINLSDDEMEDEEVNMDDVVNSIPETLAENSDDEHLSQCSDMDIDWEAMEEVYQMVAETKNNTN